MSTVNTQITKFKFHRYQNTAISPNLIPPNFPHYMVSFQRMDIEFATLTTTRKQSGRKRFKSCSELLRRLCTFCVACFFFFHEHFVVCMDRLIQGSWSSSDPDDAGDGCPSSTKLSRRLDLPQHGGHRLPKVSWWHLHSLATIIFVCDLIVLS